MGMKKGANRNDINKIKAYVKDGYSAEQISRFLVIDLTVMSRLVKHFQELDAPKKAEEPEEETPVREPDSINPSAPVASAKSKPKRTRKAPVKEGE